MSKEENPVWWPKGTRGVALRHVNIERAEQEERRMVPAKTIDDNMRAADVASQFANVIAWQTQFTANRLHEKPSAEAVMRLRQELVKTAAYCVEWIEVIDSRRGKGG